jgi:hypothetical protein
MTEHVVRMRRAEMYTGFWWKSEGKRLIGRPRPRWEDNIKMDLQKVGFGSWTGSVWLRTGTGGRYLRTR